ncbi:hypothetical protein M0R04_07860 [Candidatus Dojkabacteria bacterium]|jgi:hypothetical protein|nr:hypothetical protein [Candidatus Dojkabacteria bacterium]
MLTREEQIETGSLFDERSYLCRMSRQVKAKSELIYELTNVECFMVMNDTATLCLMYKDNGIEGLYEDGIT